MKVLIIKLTSMGDLMHALPALTEAASNINNIEFDWVIDQNFSAIASWHPAVRKTIKTNHRMWKTHFFSKKVREEIKEFKSQINKSNYDAVVDMQNNLKSAFVSYSTKYDVSGMDKKSSREFPAHWAYKSQIEVDKSLHAIQRQKILLSEALGYKTDLEKSFYGIEKYLFKKPNLDLPENYCVLVQNASWPTKLWSVKNWQRLIVYLEEKNIACLVPSGTNEEKKRADEIVSQSKSAISTDIMGLNEVAFLIDKANFCICSDTGLAHLSAVVSTPSITLYGPTNPKLIGTFGTSQTHIIAEEGKMANISLEEVLATLKI